MSEVTRILEQIEQGETEAARELFPLVYDQLRKLAARKLAFEKPGQTLQATALVHEAFIRLVDTRKAQRWDSRGHFFAAAAEAMRRILVENARRKGCAKRGGALQRMDLDLEDLATRTTPEQLLMLDEVLQRLEADDPVSGQLAKLRFFTGCSVKEAGQSLGMSRATAYRHWTYARAWLSHELAQRGAAP